MNGYVNSLAISGGNVYAGGGFTTAGGIAVDHVARWDGAAWSSVGSGIDAELRALAASGNELFAGGRFAIAGGHPANNIARWDGTRWSALGSGTDNLVLALEVFGTELYAGGIFSAAGGKRSIFVAKANLPVGPEIAVEHPGGCDLVDGDAVLDFGLVGIGASNAITFTIRNTGTTNLADLSVEKHGPDSDDFRLSPLGVTELLPGASTTLQATFVPSVIGVRTALVQVTSNDGDENPFDIALTGIGITSLEGWRLRNFGSTNNAGNASNVADPEGDGAENLKEFGFGLEPGQPDAHLLPSPVRVGDDLTVTFQQPLGVEGVTYGAEISTDLLQWTPVMDSGSAPDHTFRAPVGENSKLFMRLKVSEP